MMKKHLLVISQYFYPEEFRINDICKEWIKRGYKVTVVTGIPNYPQGKFYKGYGWFKKRCENMEGINIIRLPIIPRGKNAITLMLNYISFVLSGYIWVVHASIKADLVFIFEVSPMTQAVPGVWYAKKHGVPCIIYVQDLWPESVETVTGIHNKRLIYQNCTRILAISESCVKNIEKRSSAWAGKVSKVRYWPQYAEEFYYPASGGECPEDILKENRFKIVFTGNIGYAQGLEILPKTAALLKREKVDCCFIIIGDGRYRQELEKEIERKEVSEMFLFLGRKKPQEIRNYMAWCDVAFLSFMDTSLFKMVIPAKLQSYLACGMPIVASASGESERIIQEAGCGICSYIGKADSLADAIKKMIQKRPELKYMGSNGRRYYERHFEKKQLMDEFEKKYLKM